MAIDTAGFAFPKPGKRPKPLRVTIQKRGTKVRTILRGEAYTEFRAEMCADAKQLCQGCGKRTELADGHVHHRKGRGAGKRNDIKRDCDWLCADCHGERHPGPQWRGKR